jgi:hypothetical protein
MLVTLQGLEVDLDPEALIVRIDETVRVAPITIDLANVGR